MSLSRKQIKLENYLDTYVLQNLIKTTPLEKAIGLLAILTEESNISQFKVHERYKDAIRSCLALYEDQFEIGVAYTRKSMGDSNQVVATDYCDVYINVKPGALQTLQAIKDRMTYVYPVNIINISVFVTTPTICPMNIDSKVDEKITHKIS